VVVLEDLEVSTPEIGNVPPLLVGDNGIYLNHREISTEDQLFFSVTRRAVCTPGLPREGSGQ
jgi:hypothetical protein